MSTQGLVQNYYKVDRQVFGGLRKVCPSMEIKNFINEKNGSSFSDIWYRDRYRAPDRETEIKSKFNHNGTLNLIHFK